MLPVNISVARSPTTIKKATERALKFELYQAKFWMFYDLFYRPEAILKTATAFHNRKPVGIAVYWDYDKLEEFAHQGYDRQVGCYVKEDFRRHKVGSQLIERIKVPKNAAVGQGLALSREFWAVVKPEAKFQ